jgi:hypothetical protein
VSGVTPSLSTLVEITSAMTFRNYQSKSGNSFTSTENVSSWITLEVGEYYKIRGTHGQSSGLAHFTVSVEVKDAYTSGHPQATREKQVFVIDQD